MAILLNVCLFIAVAITAWKWGGEPERRGGQIILCLVGLSFLRHLLLGVQSEQIDIPGLAIDIFGFAAFSWIALFAWRIWPLWASSLQLIAVAAHTARSLDIPIHPLIYVLMRTAPTYLEVIVLLIGVASYRKQMRVHGSMPSWRNWSGPLNRIAPSRLRSDS